MPGVLGVSGGIILSGTLNGGARAFVPARGDEGIEALFVYTPTTNRLEREYPVFFAPAPHRLLGDSRDPRGRERVERVGERENEIELELDRLTIQRDGRVRHHSGMATMKAIAAATSSQRVTSTAYLKKTFI